MDQTEARAFLAETLLPKDGAPCVVTALVLGSAVRGARLTAHIRGDEGQEFTSEGHDVHVGQAFGAQILIGAVSQNPRGALLWQALAACGDLRGSGVKRTVFGIERGTHVVLQVVKPQSERSSLGFPSALFQYKNSAEDGSDRKMTNEAYFMSTKKQVEPIFSPKCEL